MENAKTRKGRDLLDLCTISNILVLFIFIPWVAIFRSSQIIEALVVVSMLFLIGILIAIVMPYLLVIAHLSSLFLYFFLIWKYRDDKKVQKALLFFTVVLCISLIRYKDVIELYHSVLTFQWWGDTKQCLPL